VQKLAKQVKHLRISICKQFAMHCCALNANITYLNTNPKLDPIPDPNPALPPVASRPLGQVGPWPDLKYAKSGQVGPDQDWSGQAKFIF